MKTDILYFGYPSTATVLPNPLRWLGISQPLGDMPDVVANLVKTVAYRASLKPYRFVRFAGHSLGAHIVLNAALAARDTFAVASVLCMSAPNRPVFIAKLHNLVSLGRHPQIRYLASRAQLTDNLINVVSLLRQPGPKAQSPAAVALLHTYNDPLVRVEPMAVFDQVVTLRGPHMWFNEIRQATDPHYQYIANWMLTGVL